MPQRRIHKEKLRNFVVSIDHIEALTGIAFSPDLSDNLENSIESLDADGSKRAWSINQELETSVSAAARKLKVCECN